jgi:hypothetical protein
MISGRLLVTFRRAQSKSLGGHGTTPSCDLDTGRTANPIKSTVYFFMGYFTILSVSGKISTETV